MDVDLDWLIARCINDSRYVGMSIYNVVVLCLITAPVSLVISSQADASFAFVTAALVFCCFLSMALIFVPKVKIFSFHLPFIHSVVYLSLFPCKMIELNRIFGHIEYLFRTRNWCLVSLQLQSKSVLCFKVVEVIRHPDRPKVEGPEETDQSVSKEEEERYRKLQQENEQLQQLIAARESKLKILNQRLIERNTTSNFNGNSVNSTANPPTTVHIAPLKKSRLNWYLLSFYYYICCNRNWLDGNSICLNSEVRFATSSTEMLPNKTRIGVGIMKHTETVVTDSLPMDIPPSAALVLPEEACCQNPVLHSKSTLKKWFIKNFFWKKKWWFYLFDCYFEFVLDLSGGSINSPEESYLWNSQPQMNQHSQLFCTWNV